jgi:hypothetical protein
VTTVSSDYVKTDSLKRADQLLPRRARQPRHIETC